MISDILDTSLNLFMQYGIRSTTMDEVARQAGISKRTLYEHVSGKPELVRRAMQFYLERKQADIQAVCAKRHHAIESFYRIGAVVAGYVQQINPVMLRDLQRHYRESWALFLQHKHGFIYERLMENMQRGQETGLYHKTFDRDIVARLYIGRIEVIMDEVLFPVQRYQRATLLEEMMRYHLRAIVSEKGRQYLKQKGFTFKT